MEESGNVLFCPRPVFLEHHSLLSPCALRTLIPVVLLLTWSIAHFLRKPRSRYDARNSAGRSGDPDDYLQGERQPLLSERSQANNNWGSTRTLFRHSSSNPAARSTMFGRLPSIHDSFLYAIIVMVSMINAAYVFEFIWVLRGYIDDSDWNTPSPLPTYLLWLYALAPIPWILHFWDLWVVSHAHFTAPFNVDRVGWSFRAFWFVGLAVYITEIVHTITYSRHEKEVGKECKYTWSAPLVVTLVFRLSLAAGLVLTSFIINIHAMMLEKRATVHMDVEEGAEPYISHLASVVVDSPPPGPAPAQATARDLPPVRRQDGNSPVRKAGTSSTRTGKSPSAVGTKGPPPAVTEDFLAQDGKRHSQIDMLLESSSAPDAAEQPGLEAIAGSVSNLAESVDGQGKTISMVEAGKGKEESNKTVTILGSATSTSTSKGLVKPATQEVDAENEDAAKPTPQKAPEETVKLGAKEVVTDIPREPTIQETSESDAKTAVADSKVEPSYAAVASHAEVPSSSSGASKASEPTSNDVQPSGSSSFSTHPTVTSASASFPTPNTTRTIEDSPEPEPAKPESAPRDPTNPPTASQPQPQPLPAKLLQSVSTASLPGTEGTSTPGTGTSTPGEGDGNDESDDEAGVDASRDSLGNGTGTVNSSKKKNKKKKKKGKKGKK
ncbi:uncharacterized protein EV422DRAFT_59790 [Fimicolochytrium jonesii]|uniref:uncharacterized protein n=1 Tax=Fimicolochytrium jonesii TaxID=1396493 RepID=UPI0022FE78D8|nr:uncharacterized protein EV422DRAFT_59790 [Fimicolochytrium jonesii]KAI8820691.1 hypothetical protein EV422DRAFT_59790 [Fimicolochytrium jonesii]